MAEKRALAIGGDIAENIIRNMLKEEIPIDVVRHRIPSQGLYDVVVSWNSLQYVSFRKADDHLKEIMHRVRPGGFAYLYCIAMEWVAEQILKFEPSKYWRPMVFGDQTGKDTYMRNGLTMLDLRTVIEKAGAHVLNAQTGTFTINIPEEEKSINVGQHLAVCYVPKEGEKHAPLEKPEGLV